jgi:hypothetical protein
MAPDLFIPELQSPVPPQGTREPRLWVRRLALFEDENTIRRNIPLKTGLNIVWTPDLSSSGKRSLAHGSGKTTFCRLIRACLGESDFTTETQRHRLLHKLPKGFFAAEVMIDGVCWVSIRSFGLGESYVAQAGSIEAALTRGRQEGDPPSLDRIIRETFFSDLVGLTPPEVDDEHIWDLLRAWLSRDQECRLADILSWRSPKTQTRSRAQVVSEAAKLAMVRLAVRALDKKEMQAGVRERKLAKEAEEDRKKQSFLEQQRADRMKTLRRAFEVGDEVGFEDSLGYKGLISLATTRFEAAMGAELPLPPEQPSLVGLLRDLNAKRAAHLEEARKLERDGERKRVEATHLRSEARLGEIDVKQGQVRVCPLCRVPVDEVLASKCGISLENCNIAAIKAQIAEKEKKAALLVEDAQKSETNARQISTLVSQLSNQIRETDEQAQKAEAAIRSAQGAKMRLQDKVFDARRLLDQARALRAECETPAPTTSLNDELDRLRLQLEQGRGRAQQAIYSLETQYRAIMAAWLPDGVDGVIKLDGKGLKVDVELEGRGEVSTAALDSLKIVAFDLAALHLATEGKAILPPFLIHDSPREADLDGMLYGNLFDMIAKWEKDTGSPCFQYIVTTTTAPPPDLCGDDFVKLKMSSTPADERLFRIDL